MKTVILCGGLGTRLIEETQVKPKPMIEIGGMPILWHIMNIYGHYGHNEFMLAAGYKGESIKEYFVNYTKLRNDLTVNLKTGEMETRKKCFRDWIVNIIDTGEKSMTGGRLSRLKEHLKNDAFMLTYGDGIGTIDINKLVEFHKSHGKTATVTAVRPVARFGLLQINGDKVNNFSEKPQTGEGWINGGFFVFNPNIFDYLGGDDCVLEREPLEKLAGEGQLMAFKHEGFWRCMDTLRDKQALENLWENDTAPWKVWK